MSQQQQPKYLVVRDAVYREAVRTASTHLPSEREICERYGVSRITARKALDSLAGEGLAFREVGRGSFLTGSRGRTAVTVYLANAPEEFAEYFRREAELFGEEHPGVRILIERCGALEAVRRSLAVGGGGVLGTTHFGYLQSLGVLRPLEEEEGFPEAASTVYGNWTEWYAGGRRRHCYSLPLMVSPEVFAFNREYARELGLSPRGPESWEEVLEWGRAGASLLPQGRAATTMTRHGQLPLSYYLSASGGRPMLGADIRDLEFCFSGGEEWLTFFQRFLQVAQPRVETRGEFSPLLLGQTLFAYEAGAWVKSQAREAKIADRIAVCSIPPVRLGQPYFPNIGKWGMGVLGGGAAEAGKAAWKFVVHCCANAAAQQRLIDSFACFAVNREVFLRQQSDPSWFPYAQALTGGRMRCDHPLQHLIMGHLRNEFDSVLFESRPVEQAVASVTAFAEAVLALHRTEPERFSGIL